MFELYGPYFKFAFWPMLIVELLSFCGSVVPTLNHVIFFLITLVTIIVSIRRIEYGFWIAAAEMFTGSFGYAFYIDIGDFRISIRLAIFIALFSVWGIQAIISKQFAFWKSNLRWPLIMTGIAVISGVGIGLLHHHPLRDIFLDANAYLFYALIAVAYAVLSSWENIKRLIQIFFAGITIVTLKTLFLLGYFSHVSDTHYFKLMYAWIRNSRFGEISLMMENYYRIFFQNHIWSLIGLVAVIIVLVALGRSKMSKSNYRFLWGITIASSLNVMISFSRSIWLALGCTLLLIFSYWIWKMKLNWKKIGKIISAMLGVAVVNVVIITLIVNINTAFLFKNRATNTEESAIGSRMLLLKPLTHAVLQSPIWGTGFATTVTYQTLDLRTKQLSGGWYTTYSFEWGYLDIALKMGLIGLALYAFFIWKVCKNGLATTYAASNEFHRTMLTAMLFGIAALLLTHVTTPYINHPLGIFYLIVTAAIFQALKKQST